MTPDNNTEVAGGIAGKVAGRLKETAGSLLGRDDLAREGRLQQAGADAEVEARRRAAEARDEQEAADIEAQRADNAAERARLQAEVDAERAQELAEQDRVRETAAAARLEHEARQAEQHADRIDPEEQS